jgi:hypothetical protein
LEEPEPVGPQVSFVSGSFTGSGNTERLTRAGSGDNGPVIWPSGAAEGERPSADSSKEMMLSESLQVVNSDILNISLIYFAGRNMTATN